MTTKIVEVGIEGKTPLLMHKYPMVDIPGFEKKTPEEQAEHATYKDEKGTLYIPGLNIQRAVVSGATYSKGKGRASLQKQTAACVMVSPEYVSLGVKDYLIDSRRVVVPATRGAIIRHRPRLDKWRCEFSLEYDDVLLKEMELRKIVDDTGDRVGLMDFRPEKKGPFGRFMVVSWDNGK
jgi:hypothetical protein